MDGDADAEEAKKEPFLELFELIVVLIILSAIGLRVYHYFTGPSFATWLAIRPNLTLEWNAVRIWFSEFLVSITAFVNGFCLLFAVVIGYIIFRQYEVNKIWRQKFYPSEKSSRLSVLQGAVPSSFSVGGARGMPPANLPGAAVASFEQTGQFDQSQIDSNGRWQNVLTHIASDNPSNWRLAILEADIVLSEVLDKAGYVGDTLGDKLKSAERRPFATLNAAWDAHKVRNLIAHEGQNFELTQREARRVINLYQAAIADILRISR